MKSKRAAKTTRLPKPTPAKKTNPILLSELNKFGSSTKTAKLYGVVCVVILAATVLLWAWLGAKLQLSNADELVNSYLFENSNAFHNASLPGAHSFLIKWPLFYLIKLLGYSTGSFIAITIVAVLATVAILTLVLSRIERRPLVFGTICLALASVLLMVPAQAYPGGLLPLNMAMLATRNLEYSVYILAILMFLKSASRRGHWFLLSIATLGVLIASDKLFLGLAVGGALLGLVVFCLRRRWDAVNLTSAWLVAALAAAALGLTALALINASGLANISSGAGTPYGVAGGSKDLVLGILYGGLGLFTNFGANPAYSATIVHNIPAQLKSGVFGLGGPAYLVNLVVFGFCLFAAGSLIYASLSAKFSKKLALDYFNGLALILLFSSAASSIMFVGSSHYYAVDARYLTIWVFSLFVCAALFTRKHNWRPRHLGIAGGVLFLAIIIGVVTSLRTHNNQSAALTGFDQRNSSVTQALKHHPVSVLVGDYWRVMPARETSGNKLNVMPLADCTTPRQILSTTAWQLNLKNHSFAYLLSFDPSLSDYPRCGLGQVLSNYGRPNSSILIAGSLSRPKELLLIYDHGIHVATAKVLDSSTPGTVLPLNIADLMGTSCNRPTIMNIVAHEDDDLLFMNPDLQHDINAGHCVRSVYLTAGDAGHDKYYWLSREAGTEAAYSRMLGKKVIWIERIVKIGPKQFVSIASPRDNRSISLIFVHLPDGGLRGNGFAQTGFQSLEKLESNSMNSVDSVDRQSVYSSADIRALLDSIMHVYQPTEIRTQANYPGTTFTDHSDHMAVGRLVRQAYADYEKQQFEDKVNIPLKFYIGYPIRERPQNVTDLELQLKEDIFLEYARFDGSVCQSIETCGQTPTYGSYLSRQYQDN